MKRKSFLHRAQFLQSFTLLVVLFMLISIVRISAILPGLSKKDDLKKTEAKEKAYRKEYTRGSILDRRGSRIVHSEKPMGERKLLHPEAYSGLVGYWSVRYGASGLEKTYDTYLTRSRSKKGEKRGADLHLTIDASLQEEAYNLIRKDKGSVVVLDAKTGEILVLASSPSFDMNALEDRWDEICKEAGVLLPNAYRNPVAPGSVFKLVTSREILEEGIQNEKVEDKGYLVVNGQKIRNYNGTAYGTLSFTDGFICSSNVYFMDRALKLGASRLEEAAAAFLVGREIPLDFTSLQSAFDLEEGEENLLAVTAFGQGNTLITPLHMGMITQSIATGGIMKKPYLIRSVTDGRGNVILEGKEHTLTTTMKPQTAKKLRKAMTKAGDHYGLTRVGEGDRKIAAKTGTAQRGDGTNNAWMTAFAPADHPKYVIVVNRLQTKIIGKDLAPVVEKLLDKMLSKP